MLAGAFHRPDTNRQSRCALRSYTTDARKEARRCFGRSDRSAQGGPAIHTRKRTDTSANWRLAQSPRCSVEDVA
jgi:hypothetical protein